MLDRFQGENVDPRWGPMMIKARLCGHRGYLSFFFCCSIRQETDRPNTKTIVVEKERSGTMSLVMGCAMGKFQLFLEGTIPVHTKLVRASAEGREYSGLQDNGSVEGESIARVMRGFTTMLKIRPSFFKIHHIGSRDIKS